MYVFTVASLAYDYKYTYNMMGIFKLINIPLRRMKTPSVLLCIQIVLFVTPLHLFHIRLRKESCHINIHRNDRFHKKNSHTFI